MCYLELELARDAYEPTNVVGTGTELKNGRLEHGESP